MKNKIVVIVPVYNCEKYIERCLQSIFQQSYSNLSVIVVNDGSTDNTINVIGNIKDERLIILNKKNSGVSTARNIGLDYAEKNIHEDYYIAFIDADDFVEKNYFDFLVNSLENSDSDISCCSFFFEKTSSSKPYFQVEKDRKFSCFEATNKLVLDETIQSHSHCKLFKNHLWSDIRFPSEINCMEDQATIFKLFYNAKNGIFISNTPLYHYWQEGESICRSKVSNKKIIDSITGYIECYNFSYIDFSSEEKQTILKSAASALANVFLMLLPRIEKKKLTDSQKINVKGICSFIKENKIIKCYHPKDRKNKLKRLVYLYFRPTYRILYKLFS